MKNQSLNDIIWLLWKDFDELAEELWHTPDDARQVVDVALNSSRKTVWILDSEPKEQVAAKEEVEIPSLDSLIGFLKSSSNEDMRIIAKKLEETWDINTDLTGVLSYTDWPLIFLALEMDDMHLLDLILAAKPDLSIKNSNFHNVLMAAITSQTSYTYNEFFFLIEVIKKLAKAWINMMQMDDEWKNAMEIIRNKYFKNSYWNNEVEMVYKMVNYCMQHYWVTRKQDFTRKAVDELKKSRLSDLREFANLIETTWDVNALNQLWDTVLSTLISEKKYDIIDLLCEAWANPNLPPNSSPIAQLFWQRWDEEKTIHNKLVKQNEKIKFLHTVADELKKSTLYADDWKRMIENFDFDARDPALWLTPLMKVTRDWDIRLMQMLWEAWAHTDYIEENWYTTLMIAVATGKLDVVKCALEISSRADIDITCFQGINAEDIAKKLWFAEIASFIERHARDYDNANEIPF
ncbi:MAG: hypothetical protein ACD_2C00027G0012 [uncultured bacterium (gcode 4)]|uniref:Uncharacterized protein n=1 Tax=uncultured bacterium (gcode 4) TaxID=1234023 RepID=K2GIE2_9BACT|nr:MAG: hypothetical protein ACD_2C00027G0012 [uncultured bacterium (gcode 4)]